MREMYDFVVCSIGLIAFFGILVSLWYAFRSKLVRAVAIIVGVAIYLNIGWAIGTYYRNYIFGHTPQTFWQTVWTGGYPAIMNTGNSSPLSDQIFLMVVWPLLAGVLVPFTWAVYAIYSLVVLVWHAIVYILWLAGAGGIAKLLGVG